MSSLEEADRCVKYLNRSVLEGRVITVEKVECFSYFFSPFILEVWKGWYHHNWIFLSEFLLFKKISF